MLTRVSHSVQSQQCPRPGLSLPMPYPHHMVSLRHSLLDLLQQGRLSGLVLHGEQGPRNINNKILVHHLLLSQYFTGHTSQHLHSNFTKRNTK